MTPVNPSFGFASSTFSLAMSCIPMLGNVIQIHAINNIAKRVTTRLAGNNQNDIYVLTSGHKLLQQYREIGFIRDLATFSVLTIALINGNLDSISRIFTCCVSFAAIESVVTKIEATAPLINKINARIQRLQTS